MVHLMNFMCITAITSMQLTYEVTEKKLLPLTDIEYFWQN